MGSYLTIGEETSIHYRVKDSRFIASLFPLTDESEASTLLAGVREEYPDASHHVYALKLGVGEYTYRCSDDGEPAGSSGPPVERVLRGSELTNVMIVVTRYFGGTKLGLGGLARAYSQAAILVLEKADIVRRRSFKSLRIDAGYQSVGPVLGLVEKRGRLEGVDYGQQGITIRALVPEEEVSLLKGELRDVTGGEVRIGCFK